MKHVVISIKSLHDLRQITLSSASSYVPCCVKSCTNLHQKTCCFASSCNCTLLFLCCHLPFLIFFSNIFRFLFSCFLFFNPHFFSDVFLTKYVLKFSLSYYQMSLISSIIFLDILGYRLRQGGLNHKEEVSYPLRGISENIGEYLKIRVC